MDEVVERLARLVLIPVIEMPDHDLALPLADALIGGGLPCAEITFRTPAAAASIEAIARERPDVLVGAGTVLSIEQAETAISAGARFIVSPGFDREVVEYCQRREVAVLPGVVTPTEILMARHLGLDVLKFFPAEAAGGAAYLKAIAAPFRTFRFIPTGGIDAGRLAEYLALPQVVAVGGSWMAPADLLKARDFATISDRVREAVELARNLRPSAVGSAA